MYDILYIENNMKIQNCSLLGKSIKRISAGIIGAQGKDILLRIYKNRKVALVRITAMHEVVDSDSTACKKRLFLEKKCIFTACTDTFHKKGSNIKLLIDFKERPATRLGYAMPFFLIFPIYVKR